jgi:hypothetical protein
VIAININHDVFIKKAQSEKLKNDVEKFLIKNGLTEPKQLPTGQSKALQHNFNGQPDDKKISKHKGKGKNHG